MVDPKGTAEVLAGRPTTPKVAARSTGIARSSGANIARIMDRQTVPALADTLAFSIARGRLRSTSPDRCSTQNLEISIPVPIRQIARELEQHH
jgi:hypothetical protein